MSDTDVSDFFDDAIYAAKKSNVASLDADPEKARRSLELAEATGVPATAIYGDVETFERQNKAAMGSAIISENVHIADYLNSNPMAPRLSHDDLGQLDTASRSVSQVKDTSTFGAWLKDDSIARSFMSGYGDTPLGSMAFRTPSDVDFALANPLVGAVAASVATPIELMSRVTAGMIHLGHDGLENLFGKQFADEMAAMAEWGMNRGDLFIRGGGGGAAGPLAITTQNSKLLKDMTEALRVADAYGTEPLPGAHPIIDEIKNKQAKEDADALKDALSESAKSATRERNPDYYANFVRQHIGEREIGIDAEAVRKIYGDKIPEVGDNLLGWVPDLARKLEDAQAIGGDIHVPLADWLARVEPDVAKQLHDNIRVRDGGLTLEEAKALPKKEVIADPLQLTRGTGGFEPLFSLGDRKVKLERMQQAKETGQFGIEQGFHDFNLLDETGKTIGALNLSLQNAGKTIYVEMIQAGKDAKMYDPNFLGPAIIRDLRRQIKEQFPEAETITGHRTSGARERAGVEMTAPMPVIKLMADTPEGWGHVDAGPSLRELFQQIGGQTVDTAHSSFHYDPAFAEHQGALDAAVRSELARIAPKQAQVFTPSQISAVPERPGFARRGFHQQFAEQDPWIVVALDSPNPMGVARHEAIHHLRQQGFFTEGEWSTLERAARQNDWTQLHNIEQRYKDLPEAAKLEESIAEAYRTWKDATDKKMYPPGINAIFQKLQDLFETLRVKVKEITGQDLSWDELFQKVDTGEVGSREGNAPMKPGAFKAMDEPIEGIFDKAKAMGITQDHMDRMLNLIKERNAEDLVKATARAEKQQKREQTKEWKDRRVELREETSKQLASRPDLATDELFSTKSIKINPDYLNEAQKAVLPKDYVQRKDGVNPDELAPYFGYTSGDALVERLGMLTAERKSAGMSQRDYFNRLVDVETDRRLNAEFGDLSKKIMEEAKDQALSETQLDLVHEETLAYALAAKQEPKFTREQVRDMVKEQFEQAMVKDISSDRLFQTTGKLGRKIEEASSKLDWAEAYRVSQQRNYAAIATKEALDYEKARASLDKTAEKFKPRAVKTVDQDFTNYIHELLQGAGYRLRQVPEEIAADIASKGHTSFDAFVTENSGHGWDLAVSPDLRAGKVKPIAEMTVGEFREFKDAIDSLAHVGREVQKINVAGEKVDFANWRDGVLQNIRELPVRDKTAQQKGGRWFYRFDASLTRMEEMVKDLDLRQELGPLFNAIIRPLAVAKDIEHQMVSKLTSDLRQIKIDTGKEWRKSLETHIDQDFIRDPYDGSLFDLTRENMLQIMLNWGNRSNKAKFSGAYGATDLGRRATKAEAQVFQAKVEALLAQHATKKDWDYVQSMWDIFGGWQKDIDTLHRATSGVAPKWIANEAVMTPHGTYKGGYYPVIYDRLRSGIGEVGGLFNTNYFRASTSKGHLKERTGFTDFIDFNSSIDSLGLRMQQVIHDIAFREAVMDIGKVVYDKEIAGAIKKHYGTEYQSQMRPWLERVANHFTQNEEAVSGVNNILRRVRLNLVSHVLPLNLNVILSPDLGVFNPVAISKVWSNYKYWHKEAMEFSKELPHTFANLDRDFKEALETSITKQGWKGVQADAVRWGFTPIAKFSQSFRTVTWATKYEEALASGRSKPDAAAIADSHIRTRHGSQNIVDIPAIMASNEAMKAMTIFYGYFNTMYNWQRQIPGAVKRGDWKNAWTAAYGTMAVGTVFGALLFNKTKEGDSWTKNIAQSMALQFLGTFPFGRELGSLLIKGMPSGTPTGSAAQYISSFWNDVSRAVQGKKVEKPLTHGANIVGIGTGLPLAQIGRSAQFGLDVAQGKQRPRNIIEWARGIKSGEAKLKP